MIKKKINFFLQNKYKNKLMNLKEIIQRENLKRSFFYKNKFKSKIYLNCISKKRCSKINRNFISDYKKFNFSLSLDNACNCTYLDLALKTYKCKKISQTQKLNCILKINDKVITSRNVNCYGNLDLLEKSFSNEKKLILSIIND